MSDTTKRIELAIERIRPAMQMDGGDLRLVEWDAAQGIARVELTGASSSPERARHGDDETTRPVAGGASGCAGCDRSTATMSLGVERVLKQLVPEVRAVLTV